MAKAPSPSALRKPEPSSKPERVYPGIEVFLESRVSPDVGAEFAQTRARLSALPKAQSAQAAKVLAALDRTEALLHRLFGVKADLASLAGRPKNKR